MRPSSGTVVIAWLDPGQVRGEFAEAVLRLVTIGTLNHQVSGFMRVASGPLLDITRNSIARRFLATEADWILMLDSDMVFEPDLLENLMSHAHPQHRPVIGALCYGWGSDGPFATMYRAQDNRFYNLANPAVDQLVPVDATGTACLLVHRDVFLKLSENLRPDEEWFDRLVIDHEKVGEDMSFSARIHNAGIPIFVDTATEVGHVKHHTIYRDTFAEWRRTHRFVVASTGRSGTKYLTELLNACQIPCLHESVYGPQGPGDWFTVRGDSSWMSVPFLPEFEGMVIHLVRNPLAVLNSLAGIRLFDHTYPNPRHEPYRNFLKSCDVWGDEENETIIERISNFIVRWNNAISPHADLTVRLEDIDPERLHDIVTFVGSSQTLTYTAENFAKVPTDINARPRAEYSWLDVPKELREHATELGYE